jgi:hypothetical protein
MQKLNISTGIHEPSVQTYSEEGKLYNIAAGTGRFVHTTRDLAKLTRGRSQNVALHISVSLREGRNAPAILYIGYPFVVLSTAHGLCFVFLKAQYCFH